ncbi:MAG: fumarylacetoacetate hydrolase family protein [Pseudomonadota bacterium]
MPFDPRAAAQAIADAHTARAPFTNLSGELEPPSIADAYAAQDVLRELWASERGTIAGLKIATTTKVMQDLMGIDHPCGGMIFANCVHQSGATIRQSDFIHGVIECELAVRLAQDLPTKPEPYTPDDVRSAVGSVMAAFEIIEDRNAIYRETDAKTLIADNAWNGGVVIGAELTPPVDMDLNGLAGHVTRAGQSAGDGRTDNPMGALAWVANLAMERGIPLTAGMVVITGSLVPTFAAEAGDVVSFTIDGIGSVDVSIA